MVEYQKDNNGLGSSGPGARAAPARSATRQQMTSMQQSDKKGERTPDEWAQIIEAVANSQDRAAFTKLFQHFGPKIKAFGMSLNSGYTSEAMADELVQDLSLIHI